MSFVNKQVRVDVRECLRKSGIDFDEEFSGEVTQARNNFNIIDPKSPTVDENKRKQFHSALMLIMRISQR